MDRRRFIQSIGSTALIGALTGVGAAQSDDEGAIEIPTEHEGLDTARIDVSNGTYRTVLRGTMDPDADTSSFQIRLRNPSRIRASSASGVTPADVRRAKPVVERPGGDDVPGKGRGLDREPTESPSDPKKSDGTAGTSGDIGTMNHYDNREEVDYSGGAWIRAEDPPNLSLAETRSTMDWTESNGSVDWVHWYLWRNAWEHSLPWPEGKSTWEYDGYNVDTSFDDDQVSVVTRAEYINWNWGGHQESTEITQRIYLFGRPDGSLQWATLQDVTGEDAWLLHHHAGNYRDNVLK